MNEKIVLFGDDKSLVGILTRPDARLCVPGRPAIIFLNAGLLHRVGPYRLHVDLARQLADMGFFSLRFDTSGIGDSQTSHGSDDFEKHIVSDASAAMNSLTSHSGTESFVLLGLCTGADAVHRIAVSDNRVAGGILLDAYGYPTLEFRIRSYASGLLKPHKWIKYFTLIMKKFFSSKSSGISLTNPAGDVFGINWPTQKQAEKEISDLVRRGVNLLYIYSGGVPVYYNYRNQFKHMFRSIDFMGRIQDEFFKSADHTYTLLEQREKLIRCICAWMREKFT